MKLNDIPPTATASLAADSVPAGGETLSGAQILVRLLERQGIQVVAGIPGGAILPVYDALSHSTQIRHVLARHEQGAGFIAQGMARVTGLPQVCMASSGPGATNLLTAIADARLDSIPLVAITGQVSQAMIGTDAFQEVDTYGLSVPITKHNFLVNSVAELLTVIPQAFRIAASGRPGPVLIDVPKNVQTQTLTVAAWPEPGRATPRAKSGATEGLELDRRLQEAAALINGAERPVLYLGGGVIHAGAADLALSLMEKASLPTVMTLMALGAVPTDHPLSLGMLGMHGARYTNLALQECDLLIAVGARFDDRATGKVAEFCPGARVIHIDIDPSELAKLKAVEVGIVGDVGDVLKALTPRVESHLRKRWLTHLAGLKARYPLAMPGRENPRTHYGLIQAVADRLDEIAPQGAIITTDVGQHQMWVAQAFPLRHPRRWLTSGGLGTMGFGLPAAIGAALAAPDKPVVCFSGDGSILMNVQELATAAELGVNVKVVLLNNGALGLVQQQQQLFYGQRVFASQFQGQPQFLRLAEAFGLRAVDLDGAADPRAVLHDALATPGPCLIHVAIDPQENVFPMVPPGAANSEMIG